LTKFDYKKLIKKIEKKTKDDAENFLKLTEKEQAMVISGMMSSILFFYRNLNKKKKQKESLFNIFNDIR